MSLLKKNNLKITDSRFTSILRETVISPSHEIENSESLPNIVKDYLKRWPGFFNFLKKAIGPGHSPGNHYNLKERINKIFATKLHDKVILNLGSGTYRIDPEIINVDLFPFKEVDLVADITHMPFNDGTIDAVICDAVLEHVARAPHVLKEINRILKPGGTLFVSVPFMYPYHSSPDDFYRWTAEGLQYFLKENGFSVEDIGASAGPMGTLQGVLMHIFAIVFSFGSKALYFILVQFFMLLLAPLKLLDYFFMLFKDFSMETASHIFIVAEKINIKN